ncbi:MAG TPA: OmpH family outer membrane protein [Bacteroidia bacterium]|jgi:outer membrane protein
MNKNISLLLNVVLIIAVAVLYFLHFSSPSTCAATTEGTDSTAVAKPVVMAPKDIKASKIVYVNLDVLNEKYDYIKDVNTSARAEQSSLERQYQTKGQKLQEDYTAFQQKAQQGLLSENQINAEQEAFARRKEELDQLEMKSQDLMAKIEERSQEMNTSIKEYLKEYNKNSNYNFVMAFSDGPLSPVLIANDSLDITNEILEGLNAQYKAGKGKKK